MGSKNIISLSLLLFAILFSLVSAQVKLSENLGYVTQGSPRQKNIGLSSHFTSNRFKRDDHMEHYPLTVPPIQHWRGLDNIEDDSLKGSSYRRHFDKKPILNVPDVYKPVMNEKREIKYSSRKDLIERNPWWTFASSVTKVTLGGTWWGIGFELAGLACSGLAYWDDVPKVANNVCATIGLIGPIINVFSGRGQIKDAWRLFKYGYNRKMLANEWELTYVTGYEKRQAEMNKHDWFSLFQAVDQNSYSKRSVDVEDIKTATETLALDRARNQTGYLYHSLEEDLAILPVHALMGKNASHPALVAISYDGTLINPASYVWFENEGMVSHDLRLVERKKLDKRPSHEGETPCEHPITEYIDGDKSYEVCNPPAEENIPNRVMYGIDFYGSEEEWEQADYDIGGIAGDHNGLQEFASKTTNSMIESNWWRNCMCTDEGDHRTSTGSLQLSYDGTYEGYDDCWTWDCGGGQ